MPKKQTVVIQTDFIRLDSLLKFAGLCSTGGESSVYVREGLVYVNGSVCVQRGKKIRPEDTVMLGEDILEIRGP